MYKLLLSLVFIFPTAFGLWNCTSDGMPTVLITANQGGGNPVWNFGLPLYWDCKVPFNNTQPYFTAGDSASYGSVVPQLAFSLQVTGMAIGYGTTTPLVVTPQISESFPLSSIDCHAYGHLSDGTCATDHFNVLTPPENPYIILIDSISCSSSISVCS